jgi:hypothetical protein
VVNVFSRKAVPMHPEDQRIVEIAKELCGQLGFYKIKPETVNWREKWGIRHLPPDFFLIFRGGPFAGSIQLSRSAMGKLTPEEWKPFIASGLIYYRNITSANLKIFLTTMIPYFLVIFPASLFLVGDFLNGPSFPVTVARYVVVVSIFAGLILVFFRMLGQQKKLFFRADEQASALMGKESLLFTLNKLAAIDQSTRGSRKGRLRPTIGERINHLMNYNT